MIHPQEIEHDHNRKYIKQLDHNRERHLRRLKRTLLAKDLLTPPEDASNPALSTKHNAITKNKEHETKNQEPLPEKPFYLGAPFSYHAALRHQNNLPSNAYDN